MFVPVLCLSVGLVSEGTGLPNGAYVCQVAWCQKAQVFLMVLMFVRWPGVGRHRSSYWCLCLSGGLVSEGTGLPTGVCVCEVAWCQKAQVFPLVSMFVRWPGVRRHRSSHWCLCLSGGLVSEGTGLPTGVYVCQVALCRKAQVFLLVLWLARFAGGTTSTQHSSVPCVWLSVWSEAPCLARRVSSSSWSERLQSVVISILIVTSQSVRHIYIAPNIIINIDKNRWTSEKYKYIIRLLVWYFYMLIPLLMVSQLCETVEGIVGIL